MYVYLTIFVQLRKNILIKQVDNSTVTFSIVYTPDLLWLYMVTSPSMYIMHFLFSSSILDVNDSERSAIPWFLERKYTGN